MTGTDMQSAEPNRQPVVRMVDGEVRADSRDVAAFFKKAHGDVLRAIDVIVGTRPDLGERDFALSSYTSDLAEAGRSYRCFTMNFFAFNVLVMGFTGSDALDYKIRYAREFESMQAELQRRATVPALPQSFAEALRLAADKAEENERLTGQVRQQAEQIAAHAPKLQALARIAEADGSLCIRDAAKSLQIRPIDLKNYLVANGWIYKRPGTKEWSAYQPKLGSLLLRHKTATILHEDGHDRIRTQVRVTPKGLARLAEEMAAA